jgi:hypothetical protein
MKKAKKRVPPTGELRQSQLLTTFGPGAMVDLPDHAVLIGGLEHWHGDKVRIYEERLEAQVAEMLGLEEVSLLAPPVDDGDFTSVRSGVTAFQFPGWFLGQVDETYTAPDKRVYRTRPLVPWSQLRDGKWYLNEDRKKRPVIPVRFVQACVKGHISDIDWYAFVRDDFNAPQVGHLWFDEGGAGNDFQDIYVRLAPTANDHGVRRPLSDATIPKARMLGTCRGRQPWLGYQVHEPCDKPARLLTRAASNAYFSQVLSAIAIPDTDAERKEAVDAVYDDFLQYAEELADITRERKKQKVFYALQGFSDEEVWAEVERRKSGAQAEQKGIKQAEIETLVSSPATMGEDTPDGDFYARARNLDTLPPTLNERLSRIVLVHRLREVMALVGFTRFEPPPVTEIDGDLSLPVEMAPLAREVEWVPATENRGEGVFLAFSEDAIKSWLQQPGVIARGKQLTAGFDAWRQRKEIPAIPFPGLPYIMLQSLAHLLITAVSLECGYAASAIRERIYAGASGHGILLYTGGSGSEGTLGGLVEVGRSIEHHLTRALELGRLCSNDPVCAQHDPADIHEERFLHGAACHGCLLIAETSCERRNELLDRALVVPTVATPDAAFFPSTGFLPAG